VSELADRRRFERALHDGVQQDLIALAVRLQLAAGSGEAGAALEELRRDVHRTIEATRALAAEIYPPTLDARGLTETLRGVAHVRIRDVGRHPPELEAAVYFYCVTAGADVELYEEEGRLCVAAPGAIDSRFREPAEAAGAVFHDSAR
jgi:signal transduction histidine kinase